MGYGEIDTSDAANAGLFAVPALLITFRETLEAAIIISVLLGMLEKLDLHHLKSFVWLGVMAATMLSVLAAIIAILILFIAKESFLDDTQTILVEGIMSVVASILVAVVAMTIGNVMAVHQHWEDKLTSGIDDEETISKSSIIFLAFTSVLREGVETIIFFVGIGAAFPPESLVIPGVVGAVIGVASGIALYRWGGHMGVVLFFRCTMVLLVFIGAGIFTVGVHQLQEIGAFGEWDDVDNRPPLNVPLYDINSCCSLDSQFFVMMRVLFGYSPDPTGLEMLAYFGYHVVVWTTLVVRYFLKRRKQAQALEDAPKSGSSQTHEQDPENGGAITKPNTFESSESGSDSS